LSFALGIQNPLERFFKIPTHRVSDCFKRIRYEQLGWFLDSLLDQKV